MAGKPYKETLPAHPNGEGEVHINLDGLKAKQLTVDLGADYPQGQVTKYQRHTYSTRTKGKSSQFLTVIEPFDKKESSMVKMVEAISANEIKVLLKDGIEHRIFIKGLKNKEKPSVTFREFKGGRLTIEEQS